jgi:hypothetical protein
VPDIDPHEEIAALESQIGAIGCGGAVPEDEGRWDQQENRWPVSLKITEEKSLRYWSSSGRGLKSDNTVPKHPSVKATMS